MKLSSRRLAHLSGLLLVASCASGQKEATTPQMEAVESYVYAQPLDGILAATGTLLVNRGWRVQRSGDELGTKWRHGTNGSALGVVIQGERIDGEHCRLTIESLLATPFSPMTGSDGMAKTIDWEHGRVVNWDELEMPTTLSEAPPGYAVVGRKRDLALEWGLLQKLDPRAARGMERAYGLSPGGSNGGVAALPPLPAEDVDCSPAVHGVDRPVAERRLILLGDIPGTNEVPDFVRRLACQAALKGISTVVALELMRVDQEWVDTYFASPGSAADRAAFLHIARSFDPLTSGSRGTEAVLKLLDALRTLRDAGLPVRVIAFDAAADAPARAKARASTLERVRRIEPDALFLVVVENAQTRTVLRPEESAEEAPLGWYLSHWGLRPLPLGLRSPGGQTLSCPPGRACQALAAPSTPRPGGPSSSVELYPTPDALGIQGEYSVGALTASSPPHP